MTTEGEHLISAGIDIGTSTTKLVITRLALRNTSSLTHVPKIEIISRDVLYESPVYRTPLLDPDTIDMEGVESLVLHEYKEAGVTAASIQTGAVIITGETATKSNAAAFLARLSDLAGEFLVATAGPDLESVIAAKGSGAWAYSKKTAKTVANIDIGGGTANIAVFRHGHLLGTCTLHVGGKLIEVSDARVTYIAKPVQHVIDRRSLGLTEGGHASKRDMQTVTAYMADVIHQTLTGRLDPDEPLLYGHLPDWKGPVEVLFFSGGVSGCLYEPRSCEDGTFHDLGQDLGEAIVNHALMTDFTVCRPEETVRATVLGAGAYTTEISGATIYVDEAVLPLRNVPVFPIRFEGDYDRGLASLALSLQEAVRLFDPEEEGRDLAISMPDLPLLGFRDIQHLAAQLLNAFREVPGERPMILLLKRDLGQSLGQAIRMQDQGQSVICIDELALDQGDYIDIGKRLPSGVVPAVIKTLTF